MRRKANPTVEVREFIRQAEHLKSESRVFLDKAIIIISSSLWVFSFFLLKMFYDKGVVIEHSWLIMLAWIFLPMAVLVCLISIHLSQYYAEAYARYYTNNQKSHKDYDSTNFYSLCIQIFNAISLTFLIISLLLIPIFMILNIN